MQHAAEHRRRLLTPADTASDRGHDLRRRVAVDADRNKRSIHRRISAGTAGPSRLPTFARWVMCPSEIMAPSCRKSLRLHYPPDLSLVGRGRSAVTWACGLPITEIVKTLKQPAAADVIVCAFAGRRLDCTAAGVDRTAVHRVAREDPAEYQSFRPVPELFTRRRNDRPRGHRISIAHRQQSRAVVDLLWGSTSVDIRHLPGIC